MRKEIVCYVETSEPGIEASIRAMRGDPSSILIEHEGHKFAISSDLLKVTMEEIKSFYSRTDKPRKLTADVKDQLSSINKIIGKKKLTKESDEDYVQAFQVEYGIND